MKIRRDLFGYVLIILLSTCALACKKAPLGPYRHTPAVGSHVPDPGLVILTDQVPKFAGADIIELDSGVLLVVFCNDINAGDRFHVYKSLSHDSGRTWSIPEIMVMWNPGMEFLNCNLLKTGKRILLIMQRRKKGVGAGEGAIPAISHSDDDGKTWSIPTLMLAGSEKEMIIVNARNILTTRTHRLIVPVAYGVLKHEVGILYSLNHGLSWKESPNAFGGSNIKASKFGEPSIAQLNDGRLIMLIRTDLGWIYKSYSIDEGITWSLPEATTLQSPWTAHAMKAAPNGDLLVVYTKGPSTSSGWPRNNLTFAVSRDGGNSWEDSQTITSVPDSKYFVMQPSITFVRDQLIISFLKTSPWPDLFTNNNIYLSFYRSIDIIQ